MYTFDENIARIEQAKSDIKAAIEEKGVYVGDGNINTYAGKVRMIKAAGKTQDKNVTITENNTTTSIVADEGYILDKVNVSTDVPIQEKKELFVNGNGTYTISVDEEYEGLKTAEIEVNIPLEKGETRTYTQNGTYPLKATEGNVGIESGSIVVDVQGDEIIKLPSSLTFSGCTATGDLDMSKWDWSSITIWERMFYMCKNITSITNMPHIKPPYMNYMFNVCKGLTTIDVSNIDTSKTKELIGVFSECTNLTEINGLENWDTSNVTSLSGLFSQTKVTKIEGVENWDTSNVKSLSALFNNCINLENVNFIKNWDLSKVTSMERTFSGCDSLTEIDLRGVNTESLTSMFQFCTGSENLEKIDLRGCDLSKVTTMHSAFDTGGKLKEVYMDSSLDSLTTVNYIFPSAYSVGTFYYNSNYDYSKILAKLPSTWTAVPL